MRSPARTRRRAPALARLRAGGTLRSQEAPPPPLGGSYEIAAWRTDGATKDDDRGSFVLREARYRRDPL